MSEPLIRMLVVQSAVGACLIVLMLVLRRLLSGKVSKGLIYAMWLAVALRMLIPLELPNPVRYQNQALAPVQAAYIAEQSHRSDMAAVHAPVGSKGSEGTSMPKSESAQTININTAQSPTAAAINTSRRPLTAVQWLAGLWLLGAAAAAGYMIVINRRFVKRVLTGATVLPINFSIPVILADVPSPCLIGVFKPRILLNPISVRPENLRFALSHEQCHYRGLDHIWNLLRNILVALFWFHPLVWVAARCSKRDCERACDERATRTMSPSDAIEYARTLIALVSPRRAALGTSASFMATNLLDMKKRVTLIIDRKRVQRWACGLFAGIVLLFSAASFATGEAVVREITLPEDYQEAPVYYPSAEGLWVVLGGQMYRQSGEKTFAEVAAVPSASQIAADSQAVYTLQSEDKQILMFDLEGNRQNGWTLPEELAPFKIEIAGDKLALLSGQPAAMADGGITAEAKLYLLDKQDGKLTEVNLGTVMDVCADGSGGLLVLHVPRPGMTEAVVSRLNVHDLSVQTITEAGIQSRGIAAEPGLCNILELCQLIQYDEQAQVKTVIPVNGNQFVDSLSDIRAYNGTLYAWDTSVKRLLAIDVSENRSAGKTVLTIVNNNSFRDAFDPAMGKFLLRHPDVEIRDVAMTPDQYRTALLAGESGIDILLESSGTMWQLAGAGALAPLSDESSIIEALSMAEWMPYEEIYSTGGKLYGLPGFVMYDMWKVDADLSRQAGFAMPDYPFTWHDVYVAAETAGLGRPGKPVLMYDYTGNPNVLYNYVMTQAQKQGTLNFDTPGFREDMEAYRQMVAQGIIVLYEGGETPETVPAVVSAFADISDQTVPTPTVNGMEIAMMQSYGYCINVRSPNRELAVELLAEFAKPENQYQAEYGNQDTMLLKDIEPYSRAHYDDPQYYMTRYTPKMEQLRKFTEGKWITWNMRLHPKDILSQTDALPRYLEGAITIDEFIRVIQDRADMIQYE